MRVYRAVQKKMLRVFNGICPTRTKWIQSITETMPKFMFIEVTEAQTKSIEKNNTLVVIGTENRGWLGSQKFVDCFLKG